MKKTNKNISILIMLMLLLNIVMPITSLANNNGLTVKLLWEENDNEEIKRPDFIKVELLEKEIIKETIFLNEDNNWTYKWDNLTNSIENYDLRLKDAPKEYIFNKVSKDGIFTFTVKYNDTTLIENGVIKEANKENIINIEEDKKTDIKKVDTAIIEEKNIKELEISEKTFLTVESIWVDNDNKEKMRPDNLEIQLNKNGEAFGEVIKLNSDNNWTYKFENLDKQENGKDIVYTITEVNVPKNYEVKYGILYNDKIIVTNTYIDEVKPDPEKISFTVENIWKDEDNKGKTRPENLEIQLNRNGKAFGEVIKLNNDNSWKYTFENLDKDENGKDIVYTVTEVNVPKNYEVTYSIFTDGKIVITNAYKLTTPVVTKVDIDVEKVWVDNNNKDKTRPKYIDVQLYKNGKVFGVPVRLNEDLKWKYTWKGLVKQENGKDIDYTVKEILIPSGYTVSYTVNKKSGAKIITNTKTIKANNNINKNSGKTLPKTGIVSDLGFSILGFAFVLGGIYKIKEKDD